MICVVAEIIALVYCAYWQSCVSSVGVNKLQALFKVRIS